MCNVSGLAQTEAERPALVLSEISKRFGSLLANDRISLQLHSGEILALLGENGAGKSTLMSILFGHYRADQGSIEVFGQPLPAGNPRAALAAGIGMVHQHSALADNLSVLDNVMLGSEPWHRLRSDRSGARRRLLEVAQRFQLPVAPDARTATLSVGERQRVEILKALYRGARILILDEPTAVLTPQESLSLFAALEQMVAQGLAVIFISHKLNEVMRVSQRVAVLRAGRLVAECRTEQVTPLQLAQWMVGQSLQPAQRQPGQARREIVCELQQVSTAGNTRDRLQRVDLQLHAGEIVAIAGVSGNGQSALAELLFGTLAASAGELIFLGQPMPTRPAQRVALGIARIPEDRHGTAVVGDLPIWENAIAERLHAATFSRCGWVRQGAALRYARQLLATFDVRAAGLHVATRALSGGNMQKLILGRALRPPEGRPAARLIVAHQPCWGLDVGAVSFVQQQLFAARDAGAALLVISDDLDEVMLLGDRIAVLHQGQLTAAEPAQHWSRDSLGLAMAGQHHAAPQSAKHAPQHTV
jgi:ABC-type uncharacterized transport system ATPase subunit